MQHELDLIPASYRQRMLIKRWCQWFLLTLATISLLTLALKLYINHRQTELDQTIQNLETTKNQILQQQQQYNTLLATERRLQKNLEILNGMRSGPSMRSVLSAIDRVIDSNIWFVHWNFQRASEVTEAPPEKVATGYFVMIPAEHSTTGKPQTWKLDSQMQIKGQAKDHMSLSRFVQALLGQPEIADVKVIDTGVRNYVSSEVIDFNLSISLKQSRHE